MLTSRYNLALEAITVQLGEVCGERWDICTRRGERVRGCKSYEIEYPSGVICVVVLTHTTLN